MMSPCEIYLDLHRWLAIQGVERQRVLYLSLMARFGSAASRVIARDLELGLLEGVRIIVYYRVGCSGAIAQHVISPAGRRMLAFHWSIASKY